MTPCERCSYDPGVKPPPDAFADRFLTVCEACHEDLSRLQAKMEDWADGER